MAVSLTSKDNRYDPITSDFLKAIAGSWLRYKKQCLLVSFERGLEYHRNPDVFGVTSKLTTIEVEVKVNFYDFKNNWRKRNTFHPPNITYFLVHPSIVQKALDSNLLTSEGLLSIDLKARNNFYTNLPEIVHFKNAKTIHKEKLKIRQIATMVKAQSGTLVKLAVENVHLANRTAPPQNMLL